jgi:hypothetical protein
MTGQMNLATAQSVEILRVKKGVPTIIRYDGREYILRAEGQFNQQRKRRREGGKKK